MAGANQWHGTASEGVFLGVEVDMALLDWPQ
jgi:hypothetical protein